MGKVSGNVFSEMFGKRFGLISGKDVLRKVNLLYVFVFYLLMLYVNAWFAVNSPEFDENIPALYDRGFNLLSPAISPIFSDLLVNGLLGFFIIRWFLTDKLVLANYFLLLGIIFLCRVFVFMATETPSTYDKCSQKEWKRLQEWSPKHFKWILTGSDNTTCMDNMFSGHTAHVVGVMMFTLYYSRNFLEKSVVCAATFATMVSLVWSRMHYTSDVLIALLVTVGAFFTI
jgi:hypothetical protein